MYFFLIFIEDMGRMLMKDKERGLGTDRNSHPPGLMMWITDTKRTRAGPMGWQKTEISDTAPEAGKMSTGRGTIPGTADWSIQRTKTTDHMIKGGKSGTDTVPNSPRTPRNLGTTTGIGIIMEGMTWGIGGTEKRGMEHSKDFAKGLSIGIIMDGNGRWAKSRGLPRTAGHKKGAQVFQDIANYCDELGVESVYFYAFSTENWKRPAEEVGAIMRLFGEYLIKGFDYKNRNIRICFMGDRTALDPKLQKLMNELETDSASKTGLTVNIAVNYGGRPEIVRAAQSLAAKVAAGEMKPEDITEEALSAQMYTASQKDPDFILRPSGEKRLSNFMLWQAAYSELVEMDVLWPDFTRDDLDAAIMEFNRRSRRFGGL